MSADIVYTWQKGRRELVVVVLSFIVTLALIDIALSKAFAYPQGSNAVAGDGLIGGIRQYFDYGLSIEGKLRRWVGNDDTEAHPTITAGWPLNDAELAELPTKAETPDGTLVAGYGMSFLFHMLSGLEQQESAVTIRSVGAPAATLGHSYYRYLEDRGRHEAAVVVLGVLASSFTTFSTVTHMTWNPERPAPYMYPRYSVENNELVIEDPPLTSANELRHALADPQRASALFDWIAERDTFFDPWIFAADPADRSCLGRGLRRAWAQRQKAVLDTRAHNRNGFTNADGSVEVAKRVLAEFAADVRARGQVPIVVLIENRGFDDHLDSALHPFLQAEGIPTLSTHEVAPPSDLSNFIEDGHFTDEINLRIAQALAALMRQQGLLATSTPTKR